MIHINFQEPQTEEWKRWRAVCEEEQREHNRKIQLGHNSEVKSNVYKGQKEQVYMNLQGPFRGKCAYCEQKIYGDQPGDIEHFRPKSEVKDFEWNVVKINKDGQRINHPGYYWLSYDWKNLLPSCFFCNTPTIMRSEEKIGKGTRFPVRGAYAERPGEEINEEPLLIHPVFDNPEEHIEIDRLGILHAKSDRGEACIKIFGLNERGLPKDRKATYDAISNKMAILVFELTRNPNGPGTHNLLMELNLIKDGDEEFSLAGKKAINDCKEQVSHINNL